MPLCGSVSNGASVPLSRLLLIKDSTSHVSVLKQEIVVYQRLPRCRAHDGSLSLWEGGEHPRLDLAVRQAIEKLEVMFGR